MARKGKSKKGGLRRLFKWLVILLGIASVGYYFFGESLPNKYKDPIDSALFETKIFTQDVLSPVMGLFDEGSFVMNSYQSMTVWFSSDEDSEAVPTENLGGLSLEDQQSSELATLRMGAVGEGENSDAKKFYYVDTGDCLSNSCFSENQRQLERMGYSSLSRKHSQRTQYFEVSSVTLYPREEALMRLERLERHNQTGFQPNWKPRGKLFQLTFGQFPDRKLADELLTHLMLIQPQTGVDFEVLSKRDRFQTQLVLAGPFAGLKAARRAQGRILNSGNFNRAKIIR